MGTGLRELSSWNMRSLFPMCAALRRIIVAPPLPGDH